MADDSPDVAIASRHSQAGPYRIHYRETVGSDDRQELILVLVHGLGLSHRYMEPFAEVIGRDFRVLIPDLPGFGTTDRPQQPLDVIEHAEVLRDWLTGLRIGPVVLIANSFGCQVSAELAVRSPELVSALVLQGPSYDPAARSMPRQIGRWLRSGLRIHPGQIVNALSDFFESGPRTFVGTFRLSFNHRIELTLPHVAQPTIIVCGSRDAIVPESWAETAAALLPNGRLIVVPGGGHTLNYSAPDQFARITCAFLRTISLTGR